MAHFDRSMDEGTNGDPLEGGVGGKEKRWAPSHLRQIAVEFFATHHSMKKRSEMKENERVIGPFYFLYEVHCNPDNFNCIAIPCETQQEFAKQNTKMECERENGEKIFVEAISMAPATGAQVPPPESG